MNISVMVFTIFWRFLSTLSFSNSEKITEGYIGYKERLEEIEGQSEAQRLLAEGTEGEQSG